MVELLSAIISIKDMPVWLVVSNMLHTVCRWSGCHSITFISTKSMLCQWIVRALYSQARCDYSTRPYLNLALYPFHKRVKWLRRMLKWYWKESCMDLGLATCRPESDMLQLYVASASLVRRCLGDVSTRCESLVRQSAVFGYSWWLCDRCLWSRWMMARSLGHSNTGWPFFAGKSGSCSEPWAGPSKNLENLVVSNIFFLCPTSGMVGCFFELECL